MARDDDGGREDRAAAAAPHLPLARFLPYRLSVLSNRISARIADLYERRFDLTLPEWRVMAVLGEAAADDRPMSAQEVAQRTAMDKVMVSRAVARLIAAGRVDRAVAAEDRRRSVLTLTAEGRHIHDAVVPLAQAYERALLDRLSPRDRAALDRVLSSLEGVDLAPLGRDGAASPPSGDGDSDTDAGPGPGNG
ncbi:hypothetical protein CCR85_04520 [Rhodothalassium salexigens]|uniref:MarR family winged helix-turn-helix transcriptional regulator n=1 Tax=Rhodothalassium salexigens TaxID=1086 RepID=UPI001913B97D|nr:MarR family transcriptional regulator [Rhodothalassium salexigens]MBK5910756.1 hypothetical protein [Rhodothalassium salexigens]